MHTAGNPVGHIFFNDWIFIGKYIFANEKTTLEVFTVLMLKLMLVCYVHLCIIKKSK